MKFRNSRGGARVATLAKVIRSSVAFVLIAVAACLTTGAAQAQDSAVPARAANNAVQAAIQSAVQNIRDQVQRNRLRPTAGRPLGFAGDPFVRETYEPFEALGYAKGGIVTKAPPKAAPPPTTWLFSVWAQSSVDRERRSGFFGLTNLDSRSTS